MIVAGCDVGSLTSKAVVMKNGAIFAYAIVKSKARPWESADSVMALALNKCGIKMADVERSIGTGYGRDKITFINRAVSEITCHARGAKWLVPTVRTVIDVGGQDCKVMRVNDAGTIEKFVANDKCASGTGRFLEVMAKVINIGLEDLGDMSSRSRHPVTFANACTVWAQADVIRHINNGVAVEDIAAGINAAMTARILTLVNNLQFETDICMTGGVAKNKGIVQGIEKELGLRLKQIRRHDPQVAGALGAALIAADELEGGLA
jgi:predicted CoA-substrate-specific enzyme activase